MPYFTIKVQHLFFAIIALFMVSCGPSSIDGSSSDWTITEVYNAKDSNLVEGYKIIGFKGSQFDGIIPTTVDNNKIIAIASPKRGVAMFGIAGKDTSLTVLDLSHAKHLRTVGESTFAGCKYVTNVIMNKDLEVITDGAFAECKSLTSITWSNNLTQIGEATFYSCKALQHVTLPSNIDTLGDYAYYACNNLKTIEFNDKLSYIGMRACANCTKIQELDFPKTLSFIGEKAFLNTRLIKELTIPAKVTSIGEKAFFKCLALQKLTLKNTLGTKIDENTFYSTPIADTKTAHIYYPKSSNYPEMEIWNTFKATWLAE